MSTPPPSPVAGAGAAPVERCTVLIIGSGFSGLASAHYLEKAGITDFLILERAQAVGGTWRDNTYPGCACDVPSRLYSFSFAPKPDWSHRYARQPEIRAYLEALTTERGFRDRLRFGAEVVHAGWDADRGRWTVETADGRRFDGRFLIAGVGGLKDPRLPALPGRARFRGAQVHSARWDPTLDLRGKRVAVVGTGASAIQVVPAIAGQVDALTVFQRSPAWVLPRMDAEVSALQKGLLTVVPGLERLARLLTWLRMESRYFAIFRQDGPLRRLVMALVRRHIRAALPDPALAARVTPDYDIGCKRVLVSDDWYPALQRPHVSVVDQPIAALTEEGVQAADGTVTPCDVVVWCTGFTVDAPLGEMRITGRDGADLATVWGGRPRGWLGISMAGFPNAFLLLGPNTALGHNSVVIMIEAQVRYIVQAIRHTEGLGPGGWLDVDAAAVDRFVADVDQSLSGQVWQSGCQSWYLNAEGQNFTIWPGSTASYLWATRRFDPAVYTAGRALRPGG